MDTALAPEQDPMETPVNLSIPADHAVLPYRVKMWCLITNLENGLHLAWFILT
jgi:hypothetical protein